MSPGSRTAIGVEEVPGSGLRLDTSIGERRLGSRTWCGIEDEDLSADPELWFALPGHDPVRFRFRDQLRDDTAETLQTLKKRGYAVEVLSGDRPDAVALSQIRSGSRHGERHRHRPIKPPISKNYGKRAARLAWLVTG